MLVYYIAKIKCCQHMTFSILSKLNKNFDLQTVQLYFNWITCLLMSLYLSPRKIANVVFHNDSFFFLYLQHMTSNHPVTYVLLSYNISFFHIQKSFHIIIDFLNQTCTCFHTCPCDVRSQYHFFFLLHF